MPRHAVIGVLEGPLEIIEDRQEVPDHILCRDLACLRAFLFDPFAEIIELRQLSQIDIPHVVEFGAKLWSPRHPVSAR